MKNLNQFIIERLKLTKDSKVITYYYFPTSFNELRELLKRLLDERGKDANLNDIDVSKVESFYDSNEELGLFEKLDPHNINISNWDVSNVKDMREAFYNCENFDCDLDNWDVSNVENMQHMFDSCENFTGQGLEYWNVSKVNDMSFMFDGCENFDCNLSNWNVKNVVNMFEMFIGCAKFKGNGLEYWNPIRCRSVESMLYMFSESGVEKNKNYPDWYKTYEKIK